MIIRFVVSNFTSYKDENVLDFVTNSKIQSYLDHEVRVTNRLKVLKYLGIFGSNAFGKSNILKAIAIMKNFVLTSQLPSNLSFDGNENTPTTFTMVFEINNNYYEYSFSVLANSLGLPPIIVSESLYILYRYADSVKIYDSKEGIVDNNDKAMQIFEAGYKNTMGTLFLSYINAPERRIEGNKYSKIFGEVYDFFSNYIKIVLTESTLILAVNELSVEKIRNKLHRYDTGIEDVYFTSVSDEEKENLAKEELFKEAAKNVMANNNIHSQYFANSNQVIMIKNNEGVLDVQKLMFKHKGIKKPFNYGKESEGTKRIFCLICFLLFEGNDGQTIFIDELERSCHSEIAPIIIEDYQKLNKERRSQLVFTSHLSELMGIVLRKDEIYFVNKKDDGTSHIYSLLEFKSKTRDNIEANYLEGRYGAVPKIGVEIADNLRENRRKDN